jgi:hypothetical protein
VGQDGRVPNRRITARAWIVALPALALLVGGCATAVPVTAATHATDPVCAALILATPDSLGEGLSRRHTTAQATTAWGDPAIVLRCGVEPPGPTTERCVTVTSAVGPGIDWLVVQDDATGSATTGPTTPVPSAGSTAGAAPGAGDWTFTTYGRVPAVEVHVPAAVAATRSTTFLDGLAAAIVAHTDHRRSCL